MQNTRDIAEALWGGETDTYAHHPFEVRNEMVRVDDSTWFFKGFANAIVRETADGAWSHSSCR